jgi:hypothetical protein
LNSFGTPVARDFFEQPEGHGGIAQSSRCVFQLAESPGAFEETRGRQGHNQVGIFGSWRASTARFNHASDRAMLKR